ncbi:hypothetical protein DYB26_001666 [Aphanomyces astaci]|uniref:WW domain-containing protein n=2 Tax=Aphanomyces astaci TaxID=112090 RepID=A0A3R6XYG3_APHAT|nr:hypothetical protein DYB26_001666 [Aphanomyces astaci]
MQHGGRGALDDDSASRMSESSSPPPSVSSSSRETRTADTTYHPPISIDPHDDAEAGSPTDDDINRCDGDDGGLVLKSCLQEKGTRTGGFFHRLVGGKQHKYQVGNAAIVGNLNSIPVDTSTKEEARPPLTRVTSDVLEDIPLHEDHGGASATIPPTRSSHIDHTSPHSSFIAPEVVIHDSPSKPSTTATIGDNPHITKASYRHPILHKQQPSSSPSSVGDPTTHPTTGGGSSHKEEPQPLLVLLTIVSASGLLKVHKFGVQAPYLEMKVSSDDSSPFRTVECKKGGTEAVWNQTFTRRLQSLDDSLYVAAKASTTVIGELVVSFRTLDLSPSLTNHTLQLTRGKAAEPVGHICMQCRILDSTASTPTTSPTPAPVAPLPQQQSVALPMPSCVDKPVEPKVSVAKVKYNDVGSDTGLWDAAIRHGALMFKIPYHESSGAAPKRKWVALQDLPKKGLCITWTDPQHSVESTSSQHLLPLHDVVEVKTGIKTLAFRKQHAAQGKANTFFHEDVCFSLISASRSLDLAAASKEEATLWVASLRRMLQHQTTTPTSTSCSIVGGGGRLRTSAKIMQDFKTSATRDKSTHAMWMQDLFRYAKGQQLSEIAHFLMDGCPVDLLEPQTGDTILFLACRAGHVALLELCLKWGAKNDPHPTFGDTALQIAVKASQPECVRQLLSIAAKSDMDTEIVNHVDHANQAPLHVAASQGDVVCLQLLLHHGADICVVQANGHTPLHCAVLGGHESCVAYVLDVGGDAIINTGDCHGNTPLHCAVTLGHERLVKLLLESAADVTLLNNEHLTPYKLARRNPKSRAIQALLAIYEPEPPPTPSKEQHRNLWQSTPHSQSARLQVRDAIIKQKSQMLSSPAKSLSARSASEGEFDGYTSSSSATSCSVGTLSSSSISTSGPSSLCFQDYRHQSAASQYYHHSHNTQPHLLSTHHQVPTTAQPQLHQHHHVGVPPSQQYPAYAAYDWRHDWEVKYTSEGHAYYVDLYTGVSQWDAPPALQGYDPYIAHSPYDQQLPAVPAAYDSTSQYIRPQLETEAVFHHHNNTIGSSHVVPPPPAVYTSTPVLPVYPPLATSSATSSPSASPRSKTSFSERRKLEGLSIEPLKVVTTLPDQGLNLKLDKVNDDGDMFQKVDDQALTLEKVRCLKGLFPTDDEKDSLLARQADKGEFGKAEKFMMMLDDKKQKVIWEDDKYTQLLDAGQMSGDIPLDQLDKLRRIESVPDISCLLRSELQEVLDSLINGCRACQNLLSQVKCNRLKAAEALPTGSTRTLMGIPAAAEFERFIKASVGDINDATDEFRQAKAWENKLVSEFGVVLEDFSPLEILCAVKQLLLAA